MTKRNITKLFAVAVLATGTPALASPDKPVSQQQTAKPIKPRTLPSGRPACGNTMSKSADASDCDSTVAAAPRPVATKPIALAPAARRILALFGITDTTRGTPVARPREYRNGRPANGNIPKRAAYRPIEEAPREPEEN